MFANGLHIEQGTTAPSRPGKAPRPVWTVTGPSLDAYTDALYQLGGRKYHGAFSFFEDPTAQVESLGDTDRMSFAERQDAAQERAADRADRLHGYAANHAAEAERRSTELWATLGAMNGTPVLIGHHSQRRHERALERVDYNLGRAVSEREIAADQTRRAELNERKASGEHTPRYIDNRITEAEAEIRRCERRLAHPGITPEYRAQIESVLAEYTERLAYWKPLLEAALAEAGTPVFSKANVKAGDLVLVRGEWSPVVRANPKTVSIKTRYFSHPLNYPYAEIQEHKSR